MAPPRLVMVLTENHTMLDPLIQDDPWDFYAELHERCPVFPMPEINAEDLLLK